LASFVSPVPSENFVPRYKENGGNAAFLTGLRLKSYGGQAADCPISPVTVRVDRVLLLRADRLRVGFLNEMADYADFKDRADD